MHLSAIGIGTPVIPLSIPEQLLSNAASGRNAGFVDAKHKYLFHRGTNFGRKNAVQRPTPRFGSSDSNGRTFPGQAGQQGRGLGVGYTCPSPPGSFQLFGAAQLPSNDRILGCARIRVRVVSVSKLYAARAGKAGPKSLPSDGLCRTEVRTNQSGIAITVPRTLYP